MPPKRRRRFHGLYYHSSPPKVMPMNGQTAGQNGRRRRDNDDFSVKLSTIRIWMHEKDISKLTRILWAGQGQRLCQQASNNGRVKRFLAAVPHVMNATKDLHQAVIDNNLETLQSQLEPPVPAAMVTAKDSNGLNVIHKAAGLGHTKILEYLTSLWPEGAHEMDITGKTALHWAASAKNNMRCYTLLTQAGCDEEALDYKMRTPSYYRHKPHEIERAFLVYVPEAPRINRESATDWEALSDESTDSSVGDASSSNSSKAVKKSNAKPAGAMNGRKSLDDSGENTSELDTNDGASAYDEDDSSKAEVLPTPRRPETPAAFDTVGDIESDAENMARAVEGDEDKAETEAAAEAEAEAEAETEEVAEPEAAAAVEPEAVENGIENAANGNEEHNNGELEAESEENANEKTEEEQPADDKENESDEVVVEPEVEAEEPNDTEAAAAAEQEQPENEEQTNDAAVVATAADDADAAAADEEDEDDEDVIAVTPSTRRKLAEQPEPPLEPNADDGANSLSSSLAIEGFVQGASEDFTDARLQQIIDAGDLEQLAEIVLSGEGARLLKLKANEPEIQAFLNNVPSYMEKIHRVHEAARDGGLLALQQALDRRKFAIAKDDISPNGATPLHVAVLFGHSDIVRYLASRFPETMAITDNDGRTALHYAATIKDNGHFYNVLAQLGANSKALDKLGHTPEFYVDMEKSKDVLTYSELLEVFGAEELENELLSDQGQSQPVSFKANPIFKTEQGKYLADSLADPLIKALTEIANKRPKDPVAYLTGYLQNFMGERKPAVLVEKKRNGNTLANANSKLTNSRPAADFIEPDARSMNEDDEDGALAAQQLEERDEHGQSMLHFACARSHRRGALYTLIEESRIDLTYRDELYRTARDVALQANQPNNAVEIDRFIIAQAVLGDLEYFEQLALQGYDHILDIEDESGKVIMDVATERQHDTLVGFFNNLRTLEETREELHQTIRDKNMERLKELTAAPNAKWLIKTKNYYGRTALHIAVLKESEEMVQHLVQLSPEALKVTDNLERTVLHYALGTNFCESVSRILIQNGAKRTAKDLKGRQPSYYFINKADILRLQEEEDESR
ncbi:uncharacterized protein LOC108596523 isoform X2 [Drosophila busckii]|uniref:uncharacterized protein LOC108596523 isoform X2 n=1 Tax=Drosophila busckii TaxID=30019 RepID=UPI00083EA46D|nr:uncharacterized protein LOC108596523 isoform X2 [Drosophila busckii]